MANLFNLDIDQIMHDGNEVVLMVLNGNIVYEKETFRVEYTVRSVDEYLNYNSAYGLPRIYTDANNFSFDGYTKIEITKIDGTITSNPRTKCNEIEKVKIWYPENTYGISFHGIGSGETAVKEINYCNTSNFVSMKEMFYYVPGIKKINGMNKWRTKKVTNMNNMFYYCGVTELDVSNFDTSNVINMACMFQECYSLQSLNVSNFNTSNVTTMAYMFDNCDNLTELNLSNWDVSNVSSMACMFRECYSLQSLDLSNWDISNVAIGQFGLDDMYTMMFENCTSLHTLHLDNCNNETLKRIINYGDLPTNTIDGVTKTIYCKKSQLSGVIRPDGWVYSYVDSGSEPDVPDTPDVPEEPDTRPLYKVDEFENNAKITTVEVMVDSSHTDLSSMFYNCTSLVSVNTQGWDTSNVTTMNRMFYNCNDIVSLDLSSFNTSKVTNMYWMFYACSSLTELDLSNFDIGNATTITWFLRGCDNLHTLRLDNCSHDTISRILDSTGFPTNTIKDENGAIIPRIIYCKEINATDVAKPGNWTFSYID